MSYPLKLNRELYDRIFEKCRFTDEKIRKKDMRMKYIFADSGDFIFAKQDRDYMTGEYLIYFSYDDRDAVIDELTYIFTKDIANEIGKYCDTKYYLERIYKFCSCEENSEKIIRNIFRIEKRNDIRKILDGLTVHIDRTECMEYLFKESFCIEMNLMATAGGHDRSHYK